MAAKKDKKGQKRRWSWNKPPKKPLTAEYTGGRSGGLQYYAHDLTCFRYDHDSVTENTAVSYQRNVININYRRDHYNGAIKTAQLKRRNCIVRKESVRT